MAIAALITWLVTAGLGFTMLRTWIANGALRPAGGDRSAATRLPPPLVFGHFLLAAAGLVVWIIYLIIDKQVLVWIAFGLLVVVAILGDLLFARWWHSRREEAMPESRLPTPLVYGHGLFAVVTLVLVLLTGIGVGGS
jgi:manganese efflux pump family protein